MLSFIKVLLGWHDCPKEVPVSFQNAMKKTFEQIIERERIKREWANIWEMQKTKEGQKIQSDKSSYT